MPSVSRTLLVMAVACAVAVAEGDAQSDIATGTLQGLVVAGSGEVVGAAAVSVTNADTGSRSVQITDPEGRFRIPLLSPGRYSMLVELEGFAPYEHRDIRIQVGEAPFIRIRLESPTVADRLVVTGETPLVETTRSSITSTIDSRAIQSLPLNGRDFKDLILLAPQVGEAFGRPTVAGGEGMMNSFNIDGADSNSLYLGEQLGGIIAPFTYSREAIREFQVLRSSYNVRFGGAAGGIVNAVTKSGTNTLHGTAFAFYQDAGMVEADAFGNEQEEFERRQVGASIGGPLRRDKIHGFFAYDSQRRRQGTFRRPLGLPTELEPAFDAKLASLGIDPETEFDYVFTNDTDVFLARLDWTLGERHRLWIRNNFSDQAGNNTTFSFVTSGWSNLGREKSSVNSTAGSLTSVLSSRNFNEMIVQYSRARRPRDPNVTAVPSTVIGNFDAVIGQAFHLPSFLDEDRLQVQENLTIQRGDHSVRLGVDYSRLEFDNSFQLSRGGRYLIPSYEEFLEERPCSELKPDLPGCLYIQAFSPIGGRVSFDTHLISVYAGDDWRPSPNVTLEYGARLEHQENPPAQNPNPAEPRTEFIPDDTNLAPRAGFAWDVEGDGRSVLRGGAGIFYSWSPSLLVGNAILGNGVNGFTLFVFQGLSPIFPEYPSRLPPQVTGLGGLPPDIFLFSPRFESPETYRMSVAYERLVSGSLRLGAELMYARSRHRMRQWNINKDPTPVDTFPDGRPIYGKGRLDPEFGQKVQFTSDGEAEYAAVVLSAHRRYTRNWSFQGSYTYSESKDHDSFESDDLIPVPEDQLNLDQDWGWSAGDARHRLVLMGAYSGPFGLAVSAIGRYRDALPVNPLAGLDLNNDGTFFDRPGPDRDLNLDRHLDRNSFRGSSAATVDLRIAKNLVMGRHEVEGVLEVFNVTAEAVYIAFDSGFVRAGKRNPNFTAPLQAAQPRTLQLGVRYRF